MKLTKKVLKELIHETLHEDNGEFATSSSGSEYWLKGSGTLNYAAFSVVSKTQIHVLALLGAVPYIDRTLSVADARKKYKELRSNGWKPVSPEELKRARMDKRTLKMYIYN